MHFQRERRSGSLARNTENQQHLSAFAAFLRIRGGRTEKMHTHTHTPTRRRARKREISEEDNKLYKAEKVGAKQEEEESRKEE